MRRVTGRTASSDRCARPRGPGSTPPRARSRPGSARSAPGATACSRASCRRGCGPRRAASASVDVGRRRPARVGRRAADPVARVERALLAVEDLEVLLRARAEARGERQQPALRELEDVLGGVADLPAVLPGEVAADGHRRGRERVVEEPLRDVDHVAAEQADESGRVLVVPLPAAIAHRVEGRFGRSIWYCSQSTSAGAPCRPTDSSSRRCGSTPFRPC